MRIVSLLVGFAVLAPAGVSAQSAIDALQPLVGVWDTEDTYHPEEGDPIVERGVRTCGLVLRDQYLQCDTEATNARGVERTYRWMINYNSVLDRYEMLSVWSNVPFKAVSSLEALDGDRGWLLRGVGVIGDTEPSSSSYSEMVLEADDRIVWTGRRISEGVSPEDAPISFVETWVRR